MSDMLQAALRYAALNWYIFPLHSIRFDSHCGCGDPACKSPGKHPRIKWSKEATCDPARVRALWEQWPTAGIGCATGPSGLLVFDLDGPKGLETFQGLTSGLRIATAVSKTARGGHVFFQGKAKTSSNGETKLDVRSTGGFVVLPPSPHASGAVYEWRAGPWDVPVAACPPALLAYANAGGKKVGGTIPSGKAPNCPPAGEGNFTSQLSGSLGGKVDWAEVDRAIACIPPTIGMTPWLHVGMALHEAGDVDWTRWDRWSSGGGDKYQGEQETSYKWTTFRKGGGIGIGSLFALAKEHGYTRSYKGVAPMETPSAVSQKGYVESDLFGSPKPEGEAEVEGLNGHAPALPDSFRQASVAFPDLGAEGKVLKTCANAIIAVRGLGITCNGDRFHERYRVGGQVMNQWAGELSDPIVQIVRVMIRDGFGFDPGKANMSDALEQECLVNARHSLRDYLDGLAWDGLPRLDTWMARYLGAPDTPLDRAVSRLSLIAAVRRGAFQPGCKFDNIIVLEGPEGRGKSSAIEILAGSDKFSDQEILSLNEKSQQEAMEGVWLYEIADLAGHRHAEVEKVKAFASRTVDRARPAYGRHRVDKPRTCIFFATTNDKKYLKSQTGNRRFWPVECGVVDLEGLKADRDQIWAEALVEERKGARLVLDPKLWVDAAERQASRMEHDPWDDILSQAEVKAVQHAGSGEWRIASIDVLGQLLELPADRQTNPIAKRAAYAMRRLGWDGPKPLRDAGVVYKGYTKPG